MTPDETQAAAAATSTAIEAHADPEAALPRMTLSEHLDELRRRLFISILAVVAVMIVAFFFHKELMDFVLEPFFSARNAAGVEDIKIIETEIGESFFQVLKVCFITGLVFASPIVLWQMWGFVAAGLYANEKKYVRIFFPISLVMFAAGIVCAYVILIPFGLRFLISWGADVDVLTQYKIASYISSCITMVFGMGFVFQLPLIMLFLQATDIVSRETLRKGWRWAVLLSFVLGMMLTDPSPITQILMAIPVVGLYFLGIWGGRFVGENAETFTWWKAWPVALGVAIFVLMIVYADQLNDMAAHLFNPETAPKEAPENGANGN